MSAILLLSVTGVADTIADTASLRAISSGCAIFNKLVPDHRSPKRAPGSLNRI